ncbi:hypothetical protein CKY10_22195 [Photorhabdus sp. HUG-39]|uniref:Uncharacterized protein n=1 Tax=Photorhabdus kayaii TaxID=230088 RepID=A0ABX0B3R8_9GAMM|nr:MULTISPECIES: hypothetical protein [Photorhabdus]MCC8375570.1 hypothetical protein [Photorhabdus bodei]MDB6368654.1 hypothetical protein [Photorhabdus bodei]NDL14272.1 hypothetical protein [Photorhabdus kayaii]NDL27787.1 hypothetical protein [Photorhabdus kayaii]RAX06568.1 hypothetical protein CKY10_22195 [Photorhabdus sp. HUG-39]
MKKKRLRKFQKELETLGLIENDPDVVGYVLFNTRNRRFVILDKYELGRVTYADDIEEAYLAMSRFAALMDIDSLPEPDKFDIAVIPVIDNPLFGLTPKKTD